jgi:hypothetical protein
MEMDIKQAADLLAERTGLRDVAPVDVRELAEHGLVRVVLPGTWPLVDPDGFTAVEELRAVGEARRAWWAASMGRWEAAETLSLRLEDFDRLAACRGVKAGRLGRYCRTEVLRLRT